jgi:hypothetical protein
MMAMTNSYDPETVRYFDIAHEGAQIRAIAQALPEIEKAVSGIDPRSVIILATDQVSRACAEFITSAPTPASGRAVTGRWPVAVASALPGYVGALDVVIVVGERGECDWASQALITAHNRGATCVYAGPAEGPLAGDVPQSELQIPALPGVEGLSPARVIATIYAVLALANRGAARNPELAGVLMDWAAAVDHELENLSPARGADINPGRELARFVAGAWSIHSGLGQPHSPEGTPTLGQRIGHVAAALWSAHGIPAAAVDTAQLPMVLEKYHERARELDAGTSHVDDIFYDPFIDGEAPRADLVPLKVILWAQDNTDLPHALAVNSMASHSAEGRSVTGESASPELSDIRTALCLIARAYAVTAYTPQ